MNEEIAKLAAEGKTRQEVADILGISYSALCARAKKANISFVHAAKGRSKGSGPRRPFADISGQSFDISHLDVIERDYNPPFKSHETAYKCKCQLCGEIKTYRKTNIVNGPGCHKCSSTKGGRGYREWNIGDKFGFLTIIGEGQQKGYVKCQCKCGTVRDFRLDHLKANGNSHSRTISCGCSQISSGELKILQILKDNQINFEHQYRIPELSKFMSFDFAILDENNQLIKLIEYNGEQHYHPIEKWGGEEQYLIQIERDNRKVKWCKDHDIELLVIPYTEYDQIDINYLLKKSSVIEN